MFCLRDLLPPLSLKKGYVIHNLTHLIIMYWQKNATQGTFELVENCISTWFSKVQREITCTPFLNLWRFYFVDLKMYKILVCNIIVN